MVGSGGCAGIARLVTLSIDTGKPVGGRDEPQRDASLVRTALRLRDGEFTGGNLVLVRPRFLLTQNARIAAAYAARKSPVQLARLLGIGTLGRVIVCTDLSGWRPPSC